jgi:hypothetical protein
MADVFSVDTDDTPFEAIVPAVLRSTQLPLPPPRPGEAATLPRGAPESWALSTQGFDFSRADALPADRMNRILFCGLVDSTGCTSEPPPLRCESEPVGE